MANIEKRNYHNKKTGKVTVRYRVKVRLKGYPPEIATFDRKTDADAWAAKREYELRHQKNFGVELHKTKTVGDLLKRYEDGLKLSNPKRHGNIEAILKYWDERIGGLKIGELSKDRLLQERERPIASNAVVNRKMAVLKRALNVAAHEWEWMSSNPITGIKSLPEPKGRTRFLQGDELDRLIEACKKSENPDMLAIVVLAITTGARRGEIEKIRLQEVDLKGNRILLPVTKNGKPRTLHLVGLAHDLVTQVQQRVKDGQIYLFASPHDCTRPTLFQRAWKTTLKRAKLEDFRFHDLRHSAASFLAMNGAGLHQIAEILGHSDLF